MGASERSAEFGKCHELGNCCGDCLFIQILNKACWLYIQMHRSLFQPLAVPRAPSTCNVPFHVLLRVSCTCSQDSNKTELSGRKLALSKWPPVEAPGRQKWRAKQEKRDLVCLPRAPPRGFDVLVWGFPNVESGGSVSGGPGRTAVCPFLASALCLRLHVLAPGVGRDRPHQKLGACSSAFSVKRLRARARLGLRNRPSPCPYFPFSVGSEGDCMVSPGQGKRPEGRAPCKNSAPLGVGGPHTPHTPTPLCPPRF